MAWPRKIEVDEQVYRFLVKKIKDFNDTPNSVLRRLFNLGPSVGLLDMGSDYNVVENDKHKRKPQTKLSALVVDGLLREGQVLNLIINEAIACQAKIHGDLLDWQGAHYSMSALAVKFLQDQGYETEHARGPMYWFTDEGKSIKELWDVFLDTKEFVGEPV